MAHLQRDVVEVPFPSAAPDSVLDVTTETDVASAKNTAPHDPSDHSNVNINITKDDAERMYCDILVMSSSPMCQKLSMLQSGSALATRYISLLLNVETASEPSYEQLYASRIQYDIDHPPHGVSRDLGVLVPHPSTTSTIHKTADSATTEERNLLFRLLTERIRSSAQNLTRDKKIAIYGMSVFPHETTQAVAFAVHGLDPKPGRKDIRRWYQSSPCPLEDLCANIEMAIKIKHDREKEAREITSPPGPKRQRRRDFRVSTEDAMHAFKRYIGSERQSMESYVESMSGFKPALEEYLSHGYCDVQLGYTTGDSVTLPPQSQDLVKEIVLKKSEDRSFSHLPRRVWYCNHCFSPSFVDEVVAFFDSAYFQNGRSGTGRENSVLRIVENNCPDAFFPVGRGATCALYKSQQASEMELKILNAFNTIMGIQNAVAAAASPDGKPRICVVDNVLQVFLTHMAEGGYGLHDDANKLNTSLGEDDPYRTARGDRLPTQQELQTPTWAISNIKDENTDISWFDKEGKEIGRISTAGVTFHCQGPLSQSDGTRHKVRTRKKYNNPLRLIPWRMGISGRNLVVNHLLQDGSLQERLRMDQIPESALMLCKYDETNVITNIIGPPSVLRHVKAKASTARVAASLFGIETNQDIPAQLHRLIKSRTAVKYGREQPKRLPQEEYIELCEEEGIIHPGLLIAMPLPAYKLLLSPEYIVKLLRQNHVVRIKLAECVVDSLFCHRNQDDEKKMTFYRPGNTYNMQQICMHAGILFSEMQHDICHKDDADLVRITMAHENYKNDLEKLIRRLYDKVAGKLEEETFPVKSEYDSILYGSGGGMNKQGDKPVGLKTQSKNRVFAKLPAPQDPNNKVNKALITAALERRVVLVFVSLRMAIGAITRTWATSQRSRSTQDDHAEILKIREHFGADKNDLPPEKVALCLGYFHFVGHKTDQRTPQDLNTQYLHATNYVRKCVRFMEAQHFVFTLRPLLDDADYDILDGGPSGMLSTLTVSSKNNDSIGIRLAPHEINDVLDAVNHDVVRKSYIDSKEWLQYSDSGQYERYTGDNEGTLDDKAKYSITLPDVVDLMPFIFVAGAMRSQGLGVDGKGRARPLPDHYLGSVLRVNPLPMPNRSHDCISELLRACLYKEDDSNFREIIDAGDRVDKREKVLIEQTLFKSVLLRCTGRLHAFLCYYKWAQAHDLKPKSCVPGADEIHKLFLFIRSTRNGRMAGLISDQHSSRIPSELWQVDTFEKFICAFGQKTTDLVDSMLSLSTRVGCRKLLADTMESCAGGNSDFAFLSSQNVADVEEFVKGQPFGPDSVESVVPGYGGREGASVFLQSKGSKSVTVAEALEIIVERVQGNHNPLSEYWLQACGYYRSKNDKMVRLKVNGRRFGYVDAEHWLCKVYCHLIKTTGSRLCSVQPTASKPYCHPLPFDDAELQLTEKSKTIMESAVLAWSNNAQPEWLLPLVCRLKGEDKEPSKIGRQESKDDSGNVSTGCE